MKTFQALLFTGVLLTGASTVHAALIAEESFLIGSDPSAGEYEDDVSIIGTNPTVTGFTGAWAGGVATAETGTLSYSDASGSLQSSGGKIRMGGSDRAGRQLSQGIDGSTTGTYYLGFLYQQQTTLTGYRGFALYDGAVSSSNRPFTVAADGTTPGQLNISNDFTGASSDSTATIDNSVNFFVFEFTLSADPSSDSLALYQNPDLSSGPSVASLIYSDNGLDVAFDHIGVERFTGSGADYNIYLDEIRMSQDFQDVSTIPEPGSLALVGVGLIVVMGLVSRRRRG